MTESVHAQQSPEKWLFDQARCVRPQLAWAVALAATAGLLMILQAYLLSLACHRCVIQHAPANALIPLAAAIAVIALMRGALVGSSEQQAARASARFKQQLRDRLYSRVQQLGVHEQGINDTGNLVEIVTSGVDSIEPYLMRFLPQLALAALLPLFTLALVLPAEWRSGMVLLFSAPFIPLLMILIGRGSENLNRRQWQRMSRLAGYLLDRIQGLPDLKIFNAARQEAQAVARMSEQYRSGTMSVLRLAFLSALTLEFFATVGTAVVAVLIGFRLLHGQLSLAEGLFVLLLAPEFYLPLRSLGLAYHARMQGIAAAERILPLMSTPLPDGYSGILAAPSSAPHVTLEAVSYRYEDQRGGISDITMHLPAGSMTALAGESGSGKTTLVRLLVGLTRPQKGRITINDTDLSQLDPASWRDRLAWVPQRPYFFKGTIRENLALGREQATTEEMAHALDEAAAGFILQLPQGLETMLGDRGAGLSGGELRRLALARVFLRNATLVVLDEPTAGLDAVNEELVGQALQRLARGRTMLVITHREELLRRAEQVVVLAGGQLERITTPETYLLETAGAA